MKYANAKQNNTYLNIGEDYDYEVNSFSWKHGRAIEVLLTATSETLV